MHQTCGSRCPLTLLATSVRLRGSEPDVANDEAWIELNRAITDGSLFTADLHRLRRYLKAANDRRPSVGPSLPETIERLIAQRETQRQARWTVVGAIAAIVAAIASVLALVAMWRQH